MCKRILCLTVDNQELKVLNSFTHEHSTQWARLSGSLWGCSVSWTRVLVAAPYFKSGMWCSFWAGGSRNLHRLEQQRLWNYQRVPLKKCFQVLFYFVKFCQGWGTKGTSKTMHVKHKSSYILVKHPTDGVRTLFPSQLCWENSKQIPIILCLQVVFCCVLCHCLNKRLA